MKKILVPTDFSAPAGFAFEAACNIANKAGAEVILMHVIEDATTSSFSITGEMKQESMADRLFMLKLIEKARESMAAMVSNNPCNSPIETHLKMGSPYQSIKDIITEQNVDLVVMGTSGASGVEEFMMGSNTEKVVRYAKCPVLTIHKKQKSFDYKSIVFATALSNKEDDVVKMVKNAQRMYGSTIHMVKINTPNNFERQVNTQRDMEAFAKKHNLVDYTINVFNDVSEEEGIIYFAEQIDADMIAMATHGRTGLAHLLTGSIAEDVVNHAQRPVLTYVIGK
jgi:nucleotide-binding universal stress UspA family protein